MNFALELTSILANLSFFGGFLLTLYGLRKPETREHLRLALKNVAIRPTTVITPESKSELDG